MVDEPDIEPQSYPPILVSQTELAARLQLTTRWIRDLTNEGVLEKAEGSRYDLVATIHAYYAYKIKKEAEAKAPSAADGVKKRQEEILSRRLAREDRLIISMDEALETVDFVTGAFLTSVSGLPARITRNIEERKRIETICDRVRTSLDKAFGEQREALRTGVPVGEAESEDEA